MKANLYNYQRLRYICIVLIVSVEVEFYNFEFWVANNLQNQENGRSSPMGHQGGVGQGGSDGQVNVCHIINIIKKDA